MARYEIPAGWDISDPSTWTYRTTVDAHMGYHGPTGLTVRELREIRTSAVDYDLTDVEGTADHAEWWANVLGSLHAAAIAMAEVSPEEIETAAAALGIVGHDREWPYTVTIGDWIADNGGDLEIAASRSERVVAAIEQARSGS